MNLRILKPSSVVFLITALLIAGVWSFFPRANPSGGGRDGTNTLHSLYDATTSHEEEESEETIVDPMRSDEEIIEEISEVNQNPTDSPFKGKSVNDVIGVGGGAGGRFSGSYRRRAAKKGAYAIRTPPLSHGGSRLTNDGAYDLQFFKAYGVNPFIDTDDDPLSTFAADVDTGAYTICRKFLNDGNIPDQDAVRVEEFVNYFDYDYPRPLSGTFATYLSGGPSPFASNRRLLAIGVKGMEVDTSERKDAVLTFVIDVSGSMNRGNRLELVKRSLRLLVDELRPMDEIGIAVYGSNGCTLLGHTPLSEGKEVVYSAIDSLRSGGSTNAEEGLRIGYEMAAKAYREGWINRVILCSDGVANVGKTGPDSILEVIREQVKKGICLTTVGFGMDNYNDVLMERLGDKGNGHYAYVDDIKEARRVFVEGLVGTLQVIARDVKIQVEFNPETVRSYRLLGYENRKVADKDFRNDKVDGGEVGAGHSVTALYEIKAWDKHDPDAPLGWFRIRYKNPDYRDEVHEHQTVIKEQHIAGSLDEASANFRLAACAAQFAEILRGSHWAEGLSMDCAAEDVVALAADFPANQKIRELGTLMAKAGDLIKEKGRKKSELASSDAEESSEE